LIEHRKEKNMKQMVSGTNRTKPVSLQRLLVLVAALAAMFAVVRSPAAAPPTHVVFRLQPGAYPNYVATGFGSIWAESHRGGYGSGPLLYRINPRTNRIAATLRLPDSQCWHPAVGAGYLWVSDCGGEVANPTVYKVDPHGMKVVGHVKGTDPVFANGSVWTMSPLEDRVLRIDPQSGLVLARINPGLDVTEGWALGGSGYGSIWMHTAKVVTRIDVATNKVTAVVPLPGGKINDQPGNMGPTQAGFTAGKVWVPNVVGLFEIDPDTNTARLVPLSMHPYTQWGDIGIGTTADSVFVRTSDTTVAQIDAATGHVKATYPAAGHGGDLEVAFGSLWVAATDIDRVWREPLR
jgi:hypothetical protein